MACMQSSALALEAGREARDGGGVLQARALRQAQLGQARRGGQQPAEVGIGDPVSAAKRERAQRRKLAALHHGGRHSIAETPAAHPQLQPLQPAHTQDVETTSHLVIHSNSDFILALCRYIFLESQCFSQ